jgi:hypothetical protein
MKTIVRLIKEEFNNIIYEKRSVEGVVTKDENIGELLDHIYDEYGFDNTYVSFRDEEHVTKINPNNKFNTPTGLYTYKLSEYIHTPVYNIENFTKKFPFGSDRDRIYFYILKDDVNVLDSYTDESVLDGYVKQIQQKYKDNNEVNNLCERWLNNEYESYYSESKHNTHKFWMFIYDVLAYLYDNKSKIKDGFSKLCRELGIDGFDDDDCSGWIHPSERCQTVFFRSNLFKDEFILKNEGYGDTKFDITKLSDNEIIKLINQNKVSHIYYFDDINKLIDVLKRDVFLNNPKLIKHFLSQSQDAFEILLNEPDFIKYLDGDLDFLRSSQIAKIINKHPESIKYFKYKIHKMEYDSIVNIIIEHPELISYFDKMLKYLNGYNIAKIIRSNPKTIKHLKNYLNELNEIELVNILIQVPETIEYLKDYLYKIGENKVKYLLDKQPQLEKHFNKN